MSYVTDFDLEKARAEHAQLRAKHLVEAEKKVMECAFNVVHSIVAGDYHLPQPMNYSLNQLQDAVHELASLKKMKVRDGCSHEYLDFHKKYWDNVELNLERRFS